MATTETDWTAIRERMDWSVRQQKAEEDLVAGLRAFHGDDAKALVGCVALFASIMPTERIEHLATGLDWYRTTEVKS